MTETPESVTARVVCELLESLRLEIVTGGDERLVWADDDDAGNILTAALLAAEKRGEERERERWEHVETVLFEIEQWCRAYPVKVFPEPDFTRAAELLAAGGMSLDAISASNMRHVLTSIEDNIAAIRQG